MRIELPIATYELPTPQAGCQRLLNCFIEEAQTGKQRTLLRRSCGIASFGEVTGSSVRGLDVMNGVLYAVVGTGLYSIDENGDETQITGTIPGSTRVRMKNNGTDMIINLPDGTAYQTDGVTNVTEIVDSTFTGWLGCDVDYLDSYFVFRRPGTEQFFNTGPAEISFDALDITAADGAPDDVVGLIVNNRELILAGENTVERWYNAANQPPGSPFSRSPSGFHEIGCAAGATLCSQDNSPFMLASDKTFRRLDSNWQRVSQHGIEAVINRLSAISDGFAIPFTQEGHLCVAFTFPSAARTLVFDATTQQWHERDSLGHGAWRVNCIANVYGKQIVGDSLSGKLGYLDSDTFEEWGEPQRVSWTYQSIYADRNRASHRRFELVVAAGQGLVTGQGSNPLATLKASDNGGETFVSRPVRSLGVRGNYEARAVWWNLGTSPNRVYKVDVTDPIPLFAIDTQIEAEGARF